MRTAPDPLSALGHAVGLIVIDFRARTKAKRLCRFQTIIDVIYQSLDCLATAIPRARCALLIAGIEATAAMPEPDYTLSPLSAFVGRSAGLLPIR